MCVSRELCLCVTQVDCIFCAGGQTVDGSFYNMSADPRYVAYPPPVQFAQPPLSHGPTHPPHRGPVPPPDVTVLSAPPPMLSTFSYANSMETEGHLVWHTTTIYWHWNHWPLWICCETQYKYQLYMIIIIINSTENYTNKLYSIYQFSVHSTQYIYSFCLYVNQK